MLITENYRQQNAQLHEQHANYGVASVMHAPDVAAIINQLGIDNVLDYGAGKLGLIRTISERRLVRHKFDYRPYEPANPQYASEPEPADLVACIDVLEHIEPECIEDVLDDLQRVTQFVGFFTIATKPAMKTLPDGRNAHLIVQPMEWWLPKIWTRFEIHSVQRREDGFAVVVKSLEAAHGNHDVQ